MFSILQKAVGRISLSFGHRQMEGVVAVIVISVSAVALVFLSLEGECSAGACLP